MVLNLLQAPADNGSKITSYLLEYDQVNQSHYVLWHLSLSMSIYTSLGSKPVGADCISIDFSHLILFTVVLSTPHHQPSLRVQALDRHRYHFWFLWRGFGVCMKQKSRSRFLPWPGFDPQTWQSNGRECYP